MGTRTAGYHTLGQPKGSPLKPEGTKRNWELGSRHEGVPAQGTEHSPLQKCCAAVSWYRSNTAQNPAGTCLSAHRLGGNMAASANAPRDTVLRVVEGTGGS